MRFSPEEKVRTRDQAPGFMVAAWAILFAILALHAWHLRFVNDDFFISLRYAENWLNGLGPVWNPGERVEGYTNFLYVVLLVGVLRIGVEPVMAAQIMGFMFSCLAMILTARIFRRMFPDSHYAVALAAPCLLAFSGPYAAWTVAGLETPIFITLILAGILLFFKWLDEKKTWSIIAGGAVFALSAMTRPEGMAFYGIASAWLLIAIWRRDKKVPVSIWPALIGLIFIYLPYFIWRYSYYGYPFPNSYYARMGTSLSEDTALWKNGIIYEMRFLKNYPLLVLFSLPVFLLEKEGRDTKHFFILIILAFWMIYLVAVGGDPKPYLRFMVPALPLLAVLAAGSIRKSGALAGKIIKDDYRSKAALIFSFAIAATVCLTLLVPSFRGMERLRLNHVRAKANPERVLAGKWLFENAEHGESLACMACGAIPYYSKLESYDMFGVNDVHIAHSRLGSDRATAHGKMDREYILRKRPTFIFDYSQFDYSSRGYSRKRLSFETGSGMIEFKYWKLEGNAEDRE